MHAQRAHARLSASGSSIWLNCTMSPVLSDGVERRGSKYADEGTAAHELSERLLRERGFGQPKEAAPIVEDLNMGTWVKPYVDHVSALARQTPLHKIEQRVTLAPLWEGNPPEDMFGTVDFSAVTPDRTLHVVDLKYGKHVPVEVENNTQLLYYALGVWLSLPADVLVERVRMTVVQPRAAHPDGPVRHWDIPVVDLPAWGFNVLKPTVDKIHAQKGLTTVEGKHCRWCPAAGATCPEKRKTKTQQAQQDFAP